MHVQTLLTVSASCSLLPAWPAPARSCGSVICHIITRLVESWLPVGFRATPVKSECTVIYLLPLLSDSYIHTSTLGPQGLINIGG
ncbi:hypothetical protein OF83DRAFT_1113943 [Amylostereum chailletii]|nr:hypothetical protein OF83DRAFT_1113943 [Amylostereum chailletii]